MHRACLAICLNAVLAVACVLAGTGAGAAFEAEARKFYPAPNAPPGAPAQTGAPAAPDAAGRALRIISTADLDAFEPIILGFQAENPDIAVDYTIASTSQLMRAIHDEGAVFDLAISSAMDLQTKLANDGFAQAYRSGATDALPQWARWRNQVFAFTQEPAVLILSESAFAGIAIPRNREELIALLRDNPARFRGRIGTYDVRVSGFGYLMATQDSRNAEAYWRLMEVMGRLEARLYCCSGDMIRDVADGRLALAYNVLGSYASARIAENAPGVRIVQLNDFVNVMLRTVTIPAGARHVDSAHKMVDFLVTLGQRPELAARSGLPPIDDRVLRANNAMRPIRLGPGLLVYLDSQKRRNFLRSWTSSLVQE